METASFYYTNITKDEISRIINHGTSLERIMLLEAYDLSVSPTLSGEEDKKLLTDAELKKVFKCATKREEEELEDMFALLANMVKRKAIAEVQYIKQSNLATACNNALKEIDIYTAHVALMNRVLTLSEGNEAIKQELHKYQSIDKKLINIKFNEDTGLFEIEASSIRSMIKKAYKQMKELLKDQKRLEFFLYEFAEHYHCVPLIPRSVVRFLEASKREWALNKRFSSKYYNEIIKGGVPEQIMASFMEDNGDTEWFLPHWDDVQLTKKDKQNNIFFNG